MKIKESSDIYVVEDLIKCYDFLKNKNLEFDLVIINEEEGGYEQYVKQEIDGAILNKRLEYMKNVHGGIFVLDSQNMHKEDIELLEFVSKLTIDAAGGNVKTQLEEMEEELLSSVKNIGEYNFPKQIIEEMRVVSEETNNNLMYYNEFGGFSSDGKEYKIRINKENKLPTVWSHCLANENFGTIITENMGGFTWRKNSRLNRLTSLSNMASLDMPSEIFYLKDLKNGEEWTLNHNVNPSNNDYEIIYGFGYASLYHRSHGIMHEVNTFIPRNNSVKVNIISFKNLENIKKELKLIYYVKPVLDEDEIKSNGNIYVERSGEIVTARNLYNSDFKDEVMYLGGSENIVSFTGNKDSFFGRGTICEPEAINKVSLESINGAFTNSCVAIEIRIELDPFESKEITLCLGAEDSEIDAKNSAYKYSKVANAKEELNKIKKFWYELLDTLQVKTPLDSMNIILNGWAVYQTICCRLWARSGYYQSGGAYGFRDQLQDTLGISIIDTRFMREQIIRAASHQFIEGDVEHWWHEIVNKGIRTRFSDDLLWLVYVICEYIKNTNDYSILEEQVEYVLGEPLKKDEDERYDVHTKTNEKESIWEHCKKAMSRIELGENGLPKIGSGDWNDGFSQVGNKGIGTSVWLGFFIYSILEKVIPICEYKNETELKERYENMKEALRKNLNTVGWDGRWYKRAYADDGQALGSIENEECRIDSISQSWATISGAGDNDKKYISMESLENHLVDRENGIIKLLDPPFYKGKINPGYIKSYMPGVRENGGQYTHECCC